MEQFAMNENNNPEADIARLVLLSNAVLRQEVVYEIAGKKRLIDSNSRYSGSDTFYPISPEESMSVITEYESQVKRIIREQIQNDGTVSMTMFTCPNGNARQMLSNPESCIPDHFDKDQILFQRLRYIYWLFDQFRSIGVPLNLTLLIGDTDFLTYYSPVLETKGVDISLDIYMDRATKFRNDVAQVLMFTSSRFGNICDIWTYGDDQVDLESTRSIDRSGVHVVSLLLNTGMWEIPSLAPKNYDKGDFREELYYTKRRMNNPDRFDPSIFADVPDDIVQKCVLLKFACYEDQARYVSKDSPCGSLVLMDELPPQLKCRMLSNNDCDNIRYMFPWIREEDEARNPETLEGGSLYRAIQSMRSQQRAFKVSC